MHRLLFASSLCALALLFRPALAQEQPHANGPQIETLIDLAETLGEAHAIRSLCNGDTDQTWRNYMQNLLDMEAAGGQRRGVLTSAFNQGFRKQMSVRRACTPDLRQVEAQIAAHGRQLSEMIAKGYLE